MLVDWPRMRSVSAAARPSARGGSTYLCVPQPHALFEVKQLDLLFRFWRLSHAQRRAWFSGDTWRVGIEHGLRSPDDRTSSFPCFEPPLSRDCNRACVTCAPVVGVAAVR
eukprot:2090045-Rhodomonas_salina.1